MIRSVRQAVQFVRKKKIVLVTGKASVPNLAEAIAGRTLRGSWMAHPEVFKIWIILTGLEKSNLLFVPLVQGKRTALHPSLGPAVQRIALHRPPISPAAAKLLARVQKTGRVDSPERKARLELERALLIWSEEIHTDSGAHAIIARPWSASPFARLPSEFSLEDAQDELTLAAVRSAERAPEREARRWFRFDAVSRLLDQGRLRRRGSLIYPR